MSQDQQKSQPDEREAFEREFQASWDDPRLDARRRDFCHGWHAALQAQASSREPEAVGQQVVAHRVVRSGEYPGTSWIDGPPAAGTTGREVYPDGSLQLGYAAPTAPALDQQAVRDLLLRVRKHIGQHEMRDALQCIDRALRSTNGGAA